MNIKTNKFIPLPYKNSYTLWSYKGLRVSVRHHVFLIMAEKLLNNFIKPYFKVNAKLIPL